MLYYAITENGVKDGKTLKLLNKKLGSQIEYAQMKSCGPDFIVKLTNDDIDFVQQDKKRIAQIPISNLYKSDNTIKYIVIFMLFLQFILLVKK